MFCTDSVQTELFFVFVIALFVDRKNVLVDFLILRKIHQYPLRTTIFSNCSLVIHRYKS